LASQDLQIRAQVTGISLDIGSGKSNVDDEAGEALDPILLAHRGMQDHARIGDMLRLRGRLRAALIEYERAAGLGRYHSPALANKRARALRGLGKIEGARAVLEESVLLYPEYTPTVALLTELAAQEGDSASAIAMGERALALNPFDPNIHRLLATAYAKHRRTEESAKELRALSLLGAEPAPSE
jgi:tetratricopeptide (TPR) repeat protein